MEPVARGEVRHVIERCTMSVRRACRLLGVDRSSYHYRPRPKDDEELCERLRALAARHPRYGYRRLGALLRRDRSNPRCWASETVVSLNLKIPLGALFGRFLPVLFAQKLLYRLLDPSYEREIHIARPPVGYSVTVFLELDCR